MTLEEFRREARHAYLLLQLYETLRDHDDCDGRVLRERLLKDSPEPYRSSEGFWVQEVRFGELVLSYVTNVFGHTEVPNVFDHVLLRDSCWLDLGEHIERQIEGVRHTFSWPEGFTVSCPDVRTALYWQFACLLAGKRQSGICEVCGDIFVKNYSNKKVCNSTCRSRKSRKKNT